MAMGFVGSFVGGVVLATVLTARAARYRRPIVMYLSGALLVTAALLGSLGELGFGGACLLAASMGAVNVSYTRSGEVSLGLTYMTGTLVKMGQRIAGALLGGPKLAFLRHFVLWLGLLSGAIAGAIAHSRIGLDAIWLAAGAATLFTLVALFMPERD